MKKLSLLFISLLICFAVLLSSCQKDTVGDASESGTGEQNAFISFIKGENAIIADSAGCDFTIIRPDKCSNTVTESASSLCKAIMKITGNMPKIKTDYDARIDLEILIGETNRAQSNEALEGLGEKDFRISFNDNKLVIIGGSDDATAEAVKYFTDNYISDGVMSFTYGTEYVYTYIAPQILVGGSDISEFKIYAEGAPQSLVERVNTALFAAIGIELDITNSKEGKYIKLVADDSLENGYYMAKILNDGNIHLQSDTATGLYYSVSCFENAVAKMNVPGEIFELKLSDSGAYPPAFELFGETDDRYFLGVTNKDSLSYEIGEEIEFNISLNANGELASCARFDWTMAGDDGKKSSGSESGISGMLTLKTTLENNGFVMVTVKAIGADGNEIDGDIRFSGAACVHPELLTITVSEPDDFDEYWAEAISEMMAVEPEIIEMQEIEGKSGFKAYKMKISCAGNDKWTGATYVSGYLTYPENASPKSLDIRASFQGYGVSSPLPSYSSSHISFSVCGHSIEIGMDDTYYSTLNNGVLKNHGWSIDDNADPKNVYFRYMILRDLQALRFMKEYFGEEGNGLWDGDTITLSGSSQGGFQTIALAALDKDIDSISAGVPWLCDIGGYTDGNKIKSTFRPAFAEGLGYFDSATFASRITCTVTINAGLGDPICPPAGVAAMYNALNCPKSLTFVQNKTHSYTPPTGDTFTFSEG